MTLDGSGSYDFDDYIYLYEWDYNNDGVYDFSGLTPYFDVTFPWLNVGEFTKIALRVSNTRALADTDVTIVTIVAGTDPVPEPSTILLLGGGLLGLGWYGWKLKKI